MLGTPDAALRATMVNVQILGLTVARYTMRIEPIASSPVDDLAGRFGPLVQYCLAGSPGRPGSHRSLTLADDSSYAARSVTIPARKLFLRRVAAELSGTSRTDVSAACTPGVAMWLNYPRGG